MKVKSLLFVGVSLLAFPYQSWAQFYTIMRENGNEKRVVTTSHSKENKMDEDYFYAYQDSMKVLLRTSFLHPKGMKYPLKRIYQSLLMSKTVCFSV